MADLFFLDTNRVMRLACPDEQPLHLDDAFRPVAGGWQLAVVPFSVAPRAPRRWALVVFPGAHVAVGAERVHAGVVELHDHDRLLIGEHEAVFSTDALPIPVPPAAGDAPCPICCEAVGSADRTGLFRCGRCGMQACNRCWELAPRRRCLTPGCPQPADFARPLWMPGPEEFVTFAGEEVRP